MPEACSSTAIEGPVDLKYRVTTHRSSDGVEAYVGDWNTFSFYYVGNVMLPSLTLHSIILDNDTGVSNSDRITSDPTVAIVASVVLNSADQGAIEIDTDGDESPDAIHIISGEVSNYNFTYIPGYGYGDHEIAVRLTTTALDPEFSRQTSWTSLSFTLDGPPASIASVELTNDTGNSSSDRITSDPNITGTLDYPHASDSGIVRVEYDVNGDGLPDGSSVVDSDGRFEFLPTGLPLGAVGLRVRSAIWSESEQVNLYSGWHDFDFVFDFEIPAIASIGLVNDDGNGPTDGITSDPRLSGSLTNANVSPNIWVEFDLDSDGVTDNRVLASGGQFEFEPLGLSEGAVNLQARTRFRHPLASQFSNSSWTAFSFTLAPNSTSVPFPGQVSLLRDTGPSNSDGVTSDPTLVGRINQPASGLAFYGVDLDYDGDGLADNYVDLSADDRFRISPQLSPNGPYELRVRARGWNYDQVRRQFSDWATVEFVLADDPLLRAEVIEVSLLNDTGSSNDDLVTVNPTLVGRIDSPYPGRSTILFFDHDGDGTSEGQVLANTDGSFTYQPLGLTFGTVEIRVLAMTLPEGDDFTDLEQRITTGDWQWTAFPFTYQQQPPQLATLRTISIEAGADG